MLLSKRKRASRAPFRLSIVALPADALNSHTDTASSWKQRQDALRRHKDDDVDGYEDHDDGGGALRARSAALDVSHGAL